MRSTVKPMQLGVSLHFWQHSYGLSRSRVGKSSMIGFLVVFQKKIDCMLCLTSSCVHEAGSGEKGGGDGE